MAKQIIQEKNLIILLNLNKRNFTEVDKRLFVVTQISHEVKITAFFLLLLTFLSQKLKSLTKLKPQFKTFVS